MPSAITWMNAINDMVRRDMSRQLLHANFTPLRFTPNRIPVSPALKIIRIIPLMALLLLVAPALGYDPLAIDKATPASAPQDFTVKDSERDREIPIRVYLPSQKEAAHVVLFSHGLGGSRTGSDRHPVILREAGPTATTQLLTGCNFTKPRT